MTYEFSVGLSEPEGNKNSWVFTSACNAHIRFKKAAKILLKILF